MERIVYLNGEYLPAERAAISPFDRGFLFSDGVYEVVRYYGGHGFAMSRHLNRLRESMAALQLKLPEDHPGFETISDELIRRNNQPDAYVYWQVTRGAADRDHAFPRPPAEPTVFAFTKSRPPLDRISDPRTMTAVTHPEIRWARCAIKSVSLLPNVLAAQFAADAGTDEAIFVRTDGTVTEGTARSVFAVLDGVLRVHPLDGTVLPSISRGLVISLAQEQKLPTCEVAFTEEQMLDAEEVFAAGTTTQVRPIIEINGHTIGSGQTGPITHRLLNALRRRIVTECNLP